MKAFFAAILIVTLTIPAAASDRDECISKRSVTACTAALKAAPNDTELLKFRAYGHAIARNNDAAIADLTEIIRLSPTADVYYQRSQRYSAKQDIARAMADLDEAIKLSPSTSNYYSARSYGHMMAGEFDKGIALCDKAIKLDPRNQSAFVMRSSAWREKKEYDRSVSDASEAIAISHSSSSLAAEAFRQRALTRIRTQDYDLAIADLDKGIEKNGSAWTLWSARGIAWRLKGDLDNALKDLDRAVSLAPVALAHRCDA